MIHYIETLIWPLTITFIVIFIFLGAMEYLYKKSAFKVTLSDFIARINAVETNQAEHVTDFNAKIKKHDKRLEKVQNDINEVKINRGLGGR